MADEPSHPLARYRVSGSIEAEYVDAGRTVLKNKKGITSLPELQLAEEQALAEAYETLVGEVRFDTPMTCDLLKHIHARIFGGLYDWAGRWRTVWISKPGMTWPAPDFVEPSMEAFERDVLRKYPATAIADDAAFCAAAGEIQGEFLVIHPFREGNARTIKLMTNLLALQTGRPLLVYDATDAAQEAYIAAAKAAFGHEYGPMAAIIRQALDRARKAR